MVEIYGHIEVPDGLRPGQSRLVDGAYSTNLYDAEGNLEGNAPFIPEGKDQEDTTDDGSSGLSPEVVRLVVGILAGISFGVVIANRAEIKAWAASKWKLLTGKKEGTASQAKATELANVEGLEPAASSAEVELADPAITMTSAEWQERFRVMVLAGALSEDQWRTLANARVEDGDAAFLELQNELGSLTAQQFVERVKMLLASGDSLSEDGAIGELVRIFGARRVRMNVPLKVAEAANPRTLTEGDV
ncbi:hypothetical protein [Arthrobacter silvisoli]|uniref:hypothetical protein n=1 Tax=Arthrobacter silvisoli TaxID=2291022 RepID=UPI000E212BF3|nr:hypothetical protein [Arthrobacter silvisoli]